MGKKISLPAVEPAVQLARYVKQLLWWHRMKGINHVSFRCHFDNHAEVMDLLVKEVLAFHTPSLFQGVPDDDDSQRGPSAARIYSSQEAEGDVQSGHADGTGGADRTPALPGFGDDGA